MTNEQLLLEAFTKGHITQTQFENGMLKAGQKDKQENGPQDKVGYDLMTKPPVSPMEALGLVPQVEGASKGNQFLDAPGKLGSAMREIKSNPLPHTLGALGGIGATMATGGAALPAVLAGIAGGFSSTPGEAAQSTLLSGAAPFLPGAGASRLAQGLKGAAAGALTSMAGDQAKSLVDDGKFSAPNPGQAALAALIGGVGGAVGARPAGAPTPKQQEQLAYQAKLKAAQDQSRTIRKMEIDSPVLAGKAKEAGTAAKEAMAEAKRAADSLKEQAARVATYDKNGFAAKQAQYASDIHANAVSVNKAQEALDDASRALRLHQSEMTAAEKAAENAHIAGLRDQVTAAQNRNTQISATRRGMDNRFLKKEDIPKLKMENSNLARNAANEAADVRAGATSVDFSHPEEVTKTLDNLLSQEQEAMEALKIQQEAAQSLKQQKLDHVASYKGAGGNHVAPEHYAAVDNALTNAEQARAAARALRESHLDHSDKLAGAKKMLIDMEPDELPEGASGVLGKVGTVLSLAPGVGIGGKLIGKGLKLADVMSAAKKVKAPEPPDAFKRILMDKVGAEANSLQPAVPEFLKMLLERQQQAPQEQAQ